MSFIAYFIATILAAFIDSVRIKKGWGIVANLNHAISFAISVFLLLICLFIFKPELWFLYIVNCVFIRGVFYDIFLNKFRGLPIDYVSNTTDSWIDREESFLSFWLEKAVYFFLLFSFVIIYYKVV